MPAAKAMPKRDQLLAAAWRLFYRDGFQRVGIDTILAEAQVAKMTLYHHFKSKDDLIVALLDERNSRIVESLDRAIAHAGANPRDRFGAVFDWLEEWFHSEDFRGCAFIRALSEFPDRRHPVHQAAWRFKKAVHDRLLMLARENRTKDPSALADALSLVLDGAIITAHATGHPATADTARAAGEKLLHSPPR